MTNAGFGLNRIFGAGMLLGTMLAMSSIAGTLGVMVQVLRCIWDWDRVRRLCSLEIWSVVR